MSPEWDGTYDGLNDWEKMLVSSGFEVGYDKGRQDAEPDRLVLTVEQEQLFLEAVRRKKAAMQSRVDSRCIEPARLGLSD